VLQSRSELGTENPVALPQYMHRVMDDQVQYRNRTASVVALARDWIGL